MRVHFNSYHYLGIFNIGAFFNINPRSECLNGFIWYGCAPNQRVPVKKTTSPLPYSPIFLPHPHHCRVYAHKRSKRLFGHLLLPTPIYHDYPQFILLKPRHNQRDVTATTRCQLLCARGKQRWRPHVLTAGSSICLWR